MNKMLSKSIKVRIITCVDDWGDKSWTYEEKLIPKPNLVEAFLEHVYLESGNDSEIVNWHQEIINDEEDKRVIHEQGDGWEEIRVNNEESNILFRLIPEGE